MKSIEVIVTEESEISVEALGIKGKGCSALTKFIEEALGEVTSSKKKPEYYATTTTKNTNQQRA